MKRILFPITVLSIMTILSCSEQRKTDKTDSIDVANMDTTANPGESFYQYATGGWQMANPIPDEHARYGTFDRLRENNQLQIQELIQDLSSENHSYGSNAQKVGDMYAMGIDSVKLNNDGASPIIPQLEEIAAIDGREEFIRAMSNVSKYAASPFFSFGVGPDRVNSSMNIAHIYQSGIGMGDRDYYLLEDEHSEMLRNEYVKLMETQFQNAGYGEYEAKKAAANVMRIEKELAESHITREMRRKPELNYHKMPVAALDSEVASFDWNLYFELMGAEGLDSINVSQIEPVKTSIAIIEKESVDALKDYLSWKVINSAAGYLSDDFVNANFEFYGKTLSGSKELRPR